MSTDHETNGTSEPAETRAGDWVSVELVFDETSDVLTGVIAPADEPIVVDLDALQALVKAGGYDQFNFQPEALEGLLRRFRGAEIGEYPIAVRRDAEISMGANADRLQVLLSTTRGYGGQPVTEERLRKAFADGGFAADLIVPSAIYTALAGAPVSNLVIGQGIAPKAGVDSRIELLIDLDCEATGPKLTESGRVDHYSVREFVIVAANHHLMRRHPPTKGTPGRDVFGKTIPAKDGRDIPLPKEMPGAIAAAEDGQLFIAEYKGHPVTIPGGIRVDKTLVMDYVDLRTGNVEFDGSVLVGGDVSAGVTIKATGDLVVKGTVERAFLHAGTDLLVAHGVTGSEHAMQGGECDVYIEAGGDVQVGFASGVKIRAGGDLMAKEYLNHCEALAMNQVLVGQTGGRGVIVGGRTHGCRGVICRASGTAASGLTHIRVGLHEALSETHREAFEERTALQDRLTQLRTMLASMEQRDDGGADQRQNLLDKIRRTVCEYEQRCVEVDVRLDEISGELAEVDDAAVVCTHRVYPGTVIEIGDASLHVRTEASGGRFYFRDDEIAWD